MSLQQTRSLAIQAVLLAGLILICVPADAHVKWFADWSIICPPRDPMRVLSSPLWRSFLVACVLCMAALAWLDWRLTRADGYIRQLGERLHRAMAPHAIDLLRLGMAAYWCMAAFTLPNTVYLTPELTAPAWVKWAQAACAILVLPRATAWIAGAGLVVLYALAIVDHGWFHLLDYPLFFALGIILMLTGRGSRSHDETGLSLLRWSTAVTLLWGGIEKFAYPEWSFQMLHGMPELSLGVSPEAAMYMYGFGEVAMAFGLLLFGVGSQVAAFMLLLVFFAAIPPFGWIDLVGHSGICVALVILSLTRAHHPLLLKRPAHNVAVHGVIFSGTIAALLSAYFGLHAVYLPVAG